jgi:ribosomal protein L20
LRRAEVDLDRKMLAELAVHEPETFSELVTVAKRSLEEAS